jgi:hypothetical protein
LREIPLGDADDADGVDEVKGIDGVSGGVGLVDLAAVGPSGIRRKTVAGSEVSHFGTGHRHSWGNR